MSENHNNLDSKLKIGIFLNVGFTIFEFVIGILSGSLALISDAGHNLTDSLSLMISFFAQKISRKEANLDHTYGYGRVTILAALINGLILFLLAFYVFYQAFQRFSSPTEVEGGSVALVALVGILMNASIAYLFRNNRDDLNMRSAYLNMFFDALASVGAFIAGVLIIITGQTIFDSLVSVLIGILLVRSSVGVVKDALNVLLDGVPTGINIQEIKAAILENKMIRDVDDLHIWAISSQEAALSCHIVIKDCSLEESVEVVEQVKGMLTRKFKIHHSTIETELVEGLHAGKM